MKIAAIVPSIVEITIVISANPKLNKNALKKTSLLKKAIIHLVDNPSGGKVRWSPAFNPVKTTIKTGINNTHNAITAPNFINGPTSLTSRNFLFFFIFFRDIKLYHQQI